MISAAKAISGECRYCQPGKSMTPAKCSSRVCQLNPGVWTGARSKLQQIKAHCLECAGTTQAVKDCEGVLLRDNGNGKVCWLHPFRLGKNPARKPRAQSEGQKRGLESIKKMRQASLEMAKKVDEFDSFNRSVQSGG